MDSEVLRMETGLPTKDVFQIVVNYISRFRDNINYYYGWRVDSITLEDQVFITLMKLRQNYTNLHLAQLFGCSVTTVTNIVLTGKWFEPRSLSCLCGLIVRVRVVPRRTVVGDIDRRFDNLSGSHHQSHVNCVSFVLTFVHVLHSLFFEDLMSSIPSRYKNKSCAPSSFSLFGNCRVIIDCTNVEIATQPNPVPRVSPLRV